jgi:hypothetical protein
MLRFGINRWELVVQQGKLELEVAEARNIGLVLLRWLLQASERAPPAVQKAYKAEMEFTTPRTQRDFMRKFEGAIRPMVVASAESRLAKLEMAVIIDSLAREECPLPTLVGCKPVSWWTQEDDQVLVMVAWRNRGNRCQWHRVPRAPHTSSTEVRFGQQAEADFAYSQNWRNTGR